MEVGSRLSNFVTSFHGDLQQTLPLQSESQNYRMN